MGSMPGSRLATYRQEVGRSPELARLAAAHALAASLRMEDGSRPLTAVLPPSSSGLKGLVSAGGRFGSGRRSGSVAGSSVAGSSCSDAGYSSSEVILSACPQLVARG